jgi:hypothetical protein
LPPAQLQYATRLPRQRTYDPAGLPGGLLAIGIISILWGGLALIAGVLSLPQIISGYEGSIPPTPPPPPAPLPPANVKPYDGDVVNPRGLQAEVRQVVTAMVKDRLRLSADRATMFEWFLADAGQMSSAPSLPTKLR